MNRLIAALCAAVLLISLSTTALAAGPNGLISADFFNAQTGKYETAHAETVKLTLNGAPLEGDVPAMIRNDRTLIPVRLVSTALNAQVLWVQDTSQVIILKGSDTIVLTIGSSTAQVNGKQVPLPSGVPATLARCQGADRTMVPLLFVSEQLGAEVTWDQATYTAAITTQTPTAPETPTPTPPPVLNSNFVTNIHADANAQTVMITTNFASTYQVVDLGDRVAVDIMGASLSPGLPGKIVVDNDMISAVRYSDHTNDLYPEQDYTVRVVLDFKSGITYAKNVKVESVQGGVLITTFLASHEEEEFVPSVPIDPYKSTIVIDPGHGGSSSGAHYEGIYEKNINLAVSLKLQALLQNYGYNVVMTRSDDTAVDLYARADIANAVEADLFVSIHSNAAENADYFSGAYTYYHPSSRRGAKLAQAIQTPLAKATGAIDRGIRDADFVVIRETDMCAVLVEMGFMTNHDELMNLVNPTYQDKLAQGIAQGIVNYMNSVSTTG